MPAWGSGPHRVRAAFTEADGERRDLKVIGAGTTRMVAAAVRLACRKLEAGRQVVTGAVRNPVREAEQIVTNLIVA